MKTKDKKIKKMFELKDSLVGNSKKKIGDMTNKIDKWRKKKAMDLFNDGIRLFELKEKDAAIKELKKALLINPKANKELTKEKIAFSIAGVYCSMNDCHNEIKYYNQALRSNSRYFDAWFEKGLIYLDLGKRKVYNLDKPLRNRWRLKLTDYKRLYKESLYCFKNAEKSDPKSAKAVYYVGYLHELLHKSKEAMKIFDMVLELENNFDNIEKSELFKRVNDEPRKIIDVCPKCNSKIKVGDDYCPGCGKKIEKRG